MLKSNKKASRKYTKTQESLLYSYSELTQLTRDVNTSGFVETGEV